MEKFTFEELENNKNWSEAVVVFTEDSFNEQYTEIQRSYAIKSDEKWFDSRMNGNSLFGNCLDGTDQGVRLDIYMRMLPSEGKRWSVDYCYITKLK